MRSTYPEKPPRNRFEALRNEIGWSNRTIARKAGYSFASVDYWAEHGKAPASVLAWMEAIAAFLKACPPPIAKKRRGGRRAQAPV